MVINEKMLSLHVYLFMYKLYRDDDRDQLLTCMAKAFRATEIGPFSASQAAISEGEKIKMPPVSACLV